jgi:glutamyl-tRNA reductase
MVNTAGEKRQAAVAQAEAIIDAGVLSFSRWLDQRASVPLIQALQQQTEAWRVAELARARKLLARGESVDAVMEALAKGLTQKMMHGAMSELHSSDAVQREQAAQAVSRMYLRAPTRSGHDTGHDDKPDAAPGTAATQR